MKTNNKPSHIIYQVIEREGKESIWNRIGVAWMHQDSKGFNITLHATPICGSIVMRQYDSTQKATTEEKGV